MAKVRKVSGTTICVMPIAYCQLQVAYASGVFFPLTQNKINYYTYIITKIQQA
jgi:hypothetical protein